MADLNFKQLFSFKKAKEGVADKEAPTNEYTDLFGQAGNSQLSNTDSKLVDSVVSTANDTGKKNILGIDQEPVLDTSSFIDQDYHLRKKLAFVRGIFFLLLFVSVSLLGYFFIELNKDFELLNPYLGRNTTQSLEDLNGKIISTQTKINDFRYRIAKINLDDFSYLSDEFLQQYSIYNSGGDSVAVTAAERQMIDLQNKLGQDFDKAKEKLLAQSWVNYGKPDYTDDQYKADFLVMLRDYLNSRKEAEMKNDLKAAELDKIVEETDQTANLIGNAGLIASLQASDFTKLSYKDVKGVIDSVNSANKNALSYIYKIKRDRLLWSKVLREIDLVTEKTDIYYKTGFFEQAGGIQYNNYQFDATNGRVVVTGEARSDDGSNFTLLANLIDEFEKSPMFKDIAMRSFAKSGDQEDGYSSVVKLDFSLQKDGAEEVSISNSLTQPLETLSIEDGMDKVKRMFNPAQETVKSPDTATVKVTKIKRKTNHQ